MGRLRPIAIYRGTLRTCARRAGPLLVIGAVVFVPLGLLETLVGRIGTVDTATDSGLVIAAVLGIALAQVAFGLIGEVFYSGALANLIAAPEGRSDYSLRSIAGSLAFGRLIAADLLYGAIVVGGMLLLIVPGVLAFTWFALVAPLIELEGLELRAAFARSRHLVRGRFWRVLAVLGPLMLVADTLDDAIRHLGHEAIGDSLPAEWLADSVANIILNPFFAVATVLITLELIRLGPLAGRASRN